ncbi:FAD-dependent oxidoreductase [Thiolinea disciformis]|uniref:FAD-dependent oxidoreductase n=1 Tax=Thiolinea disciformis TaxID=125614 RepID=UPI000370F429|nr:FAD/NAD(P)-binding oxidoreductase [Thiolinea disciformis]
MTVSTQRSLIHSAEETMMPTLSRRQFLQTLGLGAGLCVAPNLVRAATTRQHVIVVGGGFAGATAAKYLRLWSNNSIDVTLIEANANYYSPILSNLVLNGQRSLSQLAFSYTALSQQYGVRVIYSSVTQVDGNNHTVSLSNQQALSYDRLILAPGIEFLPITGLDSNIIPHAWKSGAQIQQLQQQLAALVAGGTVVMSIPPKPYRCPPGPYERACVIADFLKRNKPGAKLIVLDANASILVEPEIFGNAFNNTYAGIVQYIPNAPVQEVNSNTKVAMTPMGEFKGDVMNIIPPQRANSIIHSAGLANDATKQWAMVNPLSYESTAMAGIHVIGDAQATGQPKAGHIANSEAKVCADAILRLLTGAQPYSAPVTNSACYSPISSNTASWLTAVYAYDPNTKTMQSIPAAFGASSAASTKNYSKMFDWSTNLFADTFA